MRGLRREVPGGAVGALVSVAGIVAGVISSAPLTPAWARGCVVKSAGITLLMVAFAFFALASFRHAKGARPPDDLRRPMMWFAEKMG